MRACESFKSANNIKDWVRKSQIRKGSDFPKVRKVDSLRIRDFWNLFADRPALLISWSENTLRKKLKHTC
jgi:hypothetical protein